MQEITTIAAALASLRSAADIVRYFRDSKNALDSAEANMKLAELLNAIADAKNEMATIKEQLLEKDERIAQLERENEIRSRLIYRSFAYFLPREGDGEDGPFCQRCQDKDGNLVRLQVGPNGYWNCAVCKNNFRDGPPPSPRVRSTTSGGF